MAIIGASRAPARLKERANIRRVDIEWGTLELLLVGLLFVASLGYLLDKEGIVGQLGAALFGAAFVALTVDVVVTRRTMEKVAAGAAPFYIAFGLPEEVVHEIMFLKSLRKIRQEYRIEYEFRYNATDASKLDVKRRLTYTVVNLSDESLKHIYKLDASEPYECTITEVTAWGEDISGFSATPGKVAFEEDVSIPPNSENPKNHFRGCLEGVESVPYYDTVFIGPDLMLNAEVDITHKPDDIEVEVSFGHRKAAETIDIGGDGKRLNAALLPNSVITISWKKRAPQMNPQGSEENETSPC